MEVLAAALLIVGFAGGLVLALPTCLTRIATHVLLRRMLERMRAEHVEVWFAERQPWMSSWSPRPLRSDRERELVAVSPSAMPRPLLRWMWRFSRHLPDPLTGDPSLVRTWRRWRVLFWVGHALTFAWIGSVFLAVGAGTFLSD